MSFDAHNPAHITIICTLGPASMDPSVIRGLDACGVDLLRINLSHTPVGDLERAIEFVRRHTTVPLCLDTQGAQVRTGVVAPDATLAEGSIVELVAEPVPGTSALLTLWPASAFEAMTEGSVVGIDSYGVTLRVTDAHPGRARAVVKHGGRIGSNKAVTIDPSPMLPALTDADIAAIEIGHRMQVRHYALSFATGGVAVRHARSLIPAGATLISKIESRLGVLNMDAVIDESDAVLIDRGDLSREVPAETVPYFQKTILRRANRLRTPPYVATNLLESMVVSARPTLAEMNDIANTLLDGAHGLVLAAETAVGVDPVGVVELVRRAIEVFERQHDGPLAMLADLAPAR